MKTALAILRLATIAVAACSAINTPAQRAEGPFPIPQAAAVEARWCLSHGLEPADPNQPGMCVRENCTLLVTGTSRCTTTTVPIPASDPTQAGGHKCVVQGRSQGVDVNYSFITDEKGTASMPLTVFLPRKLSTRPEPNESSPSRATLVDSGFPLEFHSARRGGFWVLFVGSRGLLSR